MLAMFRRPRNPVGQAILDLHGQTMELPMRSTFQLSALVAASILGATLTAAAEGPADSTDGAASVPGTAVPGPTVGSDGIGQNTNSPTNSGTSSGSTTTSGTATSPAAPKVAWDSGGRRETPRALRSPPVASWEPGRLVSFTPFQSSSGECRFKSSMEPEHLPE